MCGCNGNAPAAAAQSAGGGTTFAIRLPNGTKVGSYPTQDHARVALQTAYAGNGQVVPK